MPSCLIGLGSNAGDRHESLRRAVDRLDAHPQIALVARSRLLETTPIGGPPGQGPFLNGVVLIETSLAPERLLELTGRVEIDLVARRGGLVCFVEVRLRRRGRCGEAIETIGEAKRRHLRRAAALYLHARSWVTTCRFDVIAIDLDPGEGLRLRHVPDAFR